MWTNIDWRGHPSPPQLRSFNASDGTDYWSRKQMKAREVLLDSRVARELGFSTAPKTGLPGDGLSRAPDLVQDINEVIALADGCPPLSNKIMILREVFERLFNDLSRIRHANIDLSSFSLL